MNAKQPKTQTEVKYLVTSLAFATVLGLWHLFASASKPASSSGVSSTVGSLDLPPLPTLAPVTGSLPVMAAQPAPQVVLRPVTPLAAPQNPPQRPVVIRPNPAAPAPVTSTGSSR